MSGAQFALQTQYGGSFHDLQIARLTCHQKLWSFAVLRTAIMNRPPKNKTKKEDLLEDPRFDKEDLAKASEPSKTAAGDDRNLVGVNAAFKEADFEDKMWMFWNDNKAAIVGGSLLALFFVVGVQVLRWYQEDSVRSMQVAYAEASDPAQKLAFAEKYKDESLAGVALMEVADEKYNAGEFIEAAGLYATAVEALEEATAQGRALLGQGVALIRGGDVDGGKRVLNELVDSDDALQSFKAEAIYHLASLAVQDKQYDAAKLLIAKMNTLDYGGIWASQLDGLKRSKPALADE